MLWLWCPLTESNCQLMITNQLLYHLTKGAGNKFGHTKICFSTVDHNAYGSLSHTKRLPSRAVFMESRAVHSFKITITLGSTRYCILMPRGFYYLLLLGLPQVSDGRHTMCPNLLTCILIIHYKSVSCNPTLPRNCVEPRIKWLVDGKFPGSFTINPGCRWLNQVLISW